MRRPSLSLAIPLLLLLTGCAVASTPEPVLPIDAPAVAPAPAAPPPAPRPTTIEAPGQQQPQRPFSPAVSDATADAPAPAHAFTAPVVPREKTRIVVLTYHFFDGPETPLTISTAAFREQMRWLVDHHITTITVSELMQFLDGTLALPERAAAIIIDDGSVTTYRKAFPVLKQHGIRFTLALNTKVIEKGQGDALSWEQTREMVASGLGDVASHSHSHERMDKLSDGMKRREAERSRAILEAHTGVRPEAFVFPFGAHSARARETVEEVGYHAAFGVGGRAVEHDSPRFRLPRVGITKETTLTMFAALFAEKAPRGKQAL
ncbi:MAG: polysaccharide deacetylase family protein [Minicystis sp.]